LPSHSHNLEIFNPKARLFSERDVVVSCSLTYWAGHKLSFSRPRLFLSMCILRSLWF